MSNPTQKNTRRIDLLSDVTQSSPCGSDSESLVLAMRIHLGNASEPPSQSKLDQLAVSLAALTTSMPTTRAVIAVDSNPRLPGYDLPSAVLIASEPYALIDVVPVSPWGKFVPALNALVSWACDHGATRVLFLSAETSLSPETIRYLSSHVDEDTLVAGAALPGHVYRPGLNDLNGRTTPWNTAAVWNLAKLCLLGFPLVAEGLHG